MRHIITSAAATLVLLASVGVAAPAGAAVVQPAQAESSKDASASVAGLGLPAGWTAEVVTPMTAARYHALDAKIATKSTAPTASPNYDPVTIGLCNGGFGDTVVNSWNTKKFKVIDLRCGDSASGYVHIRKYHQKASSTKTGYQPYVDKAKYPGNWDDLLNIGLSYSLQTPYSGFPEQQGTSQKWCYAQEVGLKKDGKPVVSFWNNTIISANNKSVITSYPSDYYADCAAD